MPETTLKTPISYYGGKQKLLSEILPMIPKHTQYVEPFCGGAALFWAKTKSNNEVINDIDLRVVNFWRVLQSDFAILQEKIQNTLHSEHSHTMSKEILKAGLNNNRIEYAWAYWVQTQMSFSFRMFGGFAFDNDGRAGPLTRSKREAFDSRFYERIKDVEIFNRDAIDLIRLKDSHDTFMYLDPPYPEGDCGHYDDKKDIYYSLLEILSSLKCKWLLSSYPSEQITELRSKYNFNNKNIIQPLSVSGKHNEGKTKTECLTWNYQLPQLNLFSNGY